MGEFCRRRLCALMQQRVCGHFEVLAMCVATAGVLGSIKSMRGFRAGVGRARTRNSRDPVHAGHCTGSPVVYAPDCAPQMCSDMARRGWHENTVGTHLEK